MCAYVDDQTRTAAHSLERTNLESLPDDVVFDILAWVPAQDIHYAARLVCHKWYQTTRTRDFVRAHLHQSEYGLVIQSGSDDNHSFLQFTKKGRIIEKSNFIYEFTGDAFASCNGLILERQSESLLDFRITNPATKQHLDLPSIGSNPDMRSYNLAMGMAYAVASKQYKAVRSFFSDSVELECAILTVGVDEDWKRLVDVQHLSPSAKDLLIHLPLNTQGFVHWTTEQGIIPYSEYVLTLNVETEIIKQFPAVPPSLLCGCDGKTELLYSYLPMGSCLSLLIARDNKFPVWDQVWVMEPETGEWTKLMSIDSEKQKRAFEGVSVPLNCKLYPFAWLKFREVLVFCDVKWRTGPEICIAYNIRTHEIESFDLGFSPKYFIFHRNSLAWLDG